MGIFSALKKVASWTYSGASYLYSFLDGATMPTLPPIIYRFWFDGLKPNNDKNLAIFEDSPVSVKLLLAVMGFTGILNVILQKKYLPKKAKELIILKDNKEEIFTILAEGNRIKAHLVQQNSSLEFIKFLKDLDKTALESFSRKQDLNLSEVYVHSPELREIEKTLSKVKQTNKNSHHFIVKSWQRWIGITFMSLFSAISGFGMPVVLALTIGALVQDFHLLSFGQALMETIVVLGVLSSLTNGVFTFRTLAKQKQDETSLMAEIDTLHEEANGLLKEVKDQLLLNKSDRQAVQQILNISNIEEKSFPYDFKLFKPLKEKQIGTSRINLEQFETEGDQIDSPLLNEDSNARRHYRSFTLV